MVTTKKFRVQSMKGFVLRNKKLIIYKRDNRDLNF